MIARWRLQLLAEMGFGLRVKEATAGNDAAVNRLRSAINGNR